MNVHKRHKRCLLLIQFFSTTVFHTSTYVFGLKAPYTALFIGKLWKLLKIAGWCHTQISQEHCECNITLSLLQLRRWRPGCLFWPLPLSPNNIPFPLPDVCLFAIKTIFNPAFSISQRPETIRCYTRKTFHAQYTSSHLWQALCFTNVIQALSFLTSALYKVLKSKSHVFAL